MPSFGVFVEMTTPGAAALIGVPGAVAISIPACSFPQRWRYPEDCVPAAGQVNCALRPEDGVAFVELFGSGADEAAELCFACVSLCFAAAFLRFSASACLRFSAWIDAFSPSAVQLAFCVADSCCARFSC